MPNHTLTSFDPWDNSPIAEFPVATHGDIEAAVAHGRRGLRDWSRAPELRRKVVTELADKLKAHRQDLARLISRETGKVLWESLLEVDAMTNKCALSIRAEDERRATVSKAGAGGTLTTSYRPHGVALVLGPFNFPGHLPLGHIVPALLAGNAVIFKPSEQAPTVADFLLHQFAHAGVPGDVFQVLHGRGDVAARIIDADIDSVMFTGSFEVGTKILSQLSHRPGVMTALEMGGNNPLIVWDVADTRAAVMTIIQSAFATAGQRCSCARRLILRRNDRLFDVLRQAVERLAVGRWNDEPAPFYSSLISTAAADKVLEAQGRLTGSPVVACRRSDRSAALLSPGLFETSAGSDEEIFGPLLQVSFVDTFDQAVAAANATKYGLSAGLLSDNATLWDRFRLQARAGVLTLNRPTTGASSELPFGGVGNSGNHRPSAYFAADYCSYPVAEMSSPLLTLPEKLPPGITL